MGNQIEEIEELVKKRLESAQVGKQNVLLDGYPDAPYHSGQISAYEELLRRIEEIKNG